MNLHERHSGGPPTDDDTVAVLAVVRRDAMRRSAGYEAVFTEIAKSLGLLSNHHHLRHDAQFLGLVDNLIGIEDVDLLSDRVLDLVTYINRVAQAHGVAASVATISMPDAIVMDQRPTGLTDHDISPRTRLQVR